MLRIECFDVEVLPNFFSITFVNLADYLKTFEDCVNDKGKKIPLIQKLTVGVIKDRLSRIKNKKFYITATDDSQLFSMVDYIYKFAIDSNGIPARTDLYGYNSKSYDNLMVAAFLMYFNQFDTTKELITKLFQTSKRIIELQNDNEAGKMISFFVVLISLNFLLLELML